MVTIVSQTLSSGTDYHQESMMVNILPPPFLRGGDIVSQYLDATGPLELNDILKSLSKSYDAYTHNFSRSFMFIKYYVCACICDVQLTKNYVTLTSLIQQNYSNFK